MAEKTTGPIPPAQRAAASGAPSLADGGHGTATSGAPATPARAATSASPSAYVAPAREVDRVFIHCSASDQEAHDDISVIKKWHLERGFDDVGYHFFIKKNGALQKGRSLEDNPAAQAPHNRRTIAICVHGLLIDKFTDKQFDTLRKLCHAINTAHGGKLTFHGHREVANKTCPVFDYKAVLGLDSQGHLGAA